MGASTRRPSSTLDVGIAFASIKSMERVTGVGGIFFRAKDPELLARWYQDHLGIKLTPESYHEEPWYQEAGATVFAPFAQDTDYFGRAEQQWMINLRVRDLDAMVAQLRAANINVSMDPEQSWNGRVDRLHHPEGNPIELWQPK